MKTYFVTARLKFPSCYNAGYDFEWYAATKAQAIKLSRKEALVMGHTKHDGPLVYTATEIFE